MTVTIRRTTAEVIQGSGYSARIQEDRRNHRLKVLSYEYGEVAPLADRLIQIAGEQDLGKIVLVAHGSDWRSFLTRGFVMEARVDQFYQGEPGHYMGYFLAGDRQSSYRHEMEQAILQTVLDKASMAPAPLPGLYRLIEAGPMMADELAAVYDRVFASYPSPLTDPEYIRELMRSGDGRFWVVTADGQIVSAAAAEIDRANSNAELTNCATLPDYRGEGLMAVLTQAVLEEQKESACLYSMARALSPGMNLVLRRAGFTYRGRLLGHAYIDGTFEDLNLWELDRR